MRVLLFFKSKRALTIQRSTDRRVYMAGNGLLFLLAHPEEESKMQDGRRACLPACHPASVVRESLALFKRTLDLPELQGIAVVDGRGHIGFQAFAVDAAEVGAVQVGELVGAADMFERGVAARNRVSALQRAEIDLWLHAAEIVIVAPDQHALARQGDRVAVGEDQRAPGRVWIAS